MHRDPIRPGGPRAWLVWALATTFVVWLFAIQTGYAVVSPEIQRTAGLSLTEVGLAASIYTWVLAVTQFFSGALLDRFGTRPLLAIAVALVTAGAFLYAAATSLATLALAQVVLAVGASFGFVGAGYVGGKWFEAARYGVMFGLVQSFASLGSAVGQPLIQAALAPLGWQRLLVAFGSFGVLLVIAFVLFVRDPRGADAVVPPRGRLIPSILGQLGRCLTNRRVWIATAIAATSFGTMLAVGTLWGPRLMAARGADPEFATLLTAAAWLGLAIGAPLVNVLSNRWRSRRWPAVGALLLQALAVGLVIYLPAMSPEVTLALMFGMGLFAGGQMLGFTVAGEAVVASLLGSAAAIVNGFCFLTSGLLTSIPAAVLPETPALADYAAVLWVMPVLLVLGAAAALLLRQALPQSPATALR